jgi:hypothetical protein
MIQRLNTMAGAVLLLASAWATAGTTRSAEANDWRDFDLLNGRLMISAPASAAYEKLQAQHIMAADPSEDNETQLRVKAAGTEIVVYVKELFALAPINTEAFFHEEIWGGETPSGATAPGPIALAAPLGAYGVASGSYPHPSGNNVLGCLLVAQADGTAQYVYVMTWDVDATTLKEVSAIAERMVLSLRPGARQELQSGGRHALAPQLRSGGSLIVELPDDYVLSKNQGPDFTVYDIGRLTPLGEPRGSLGVYVGDFPALHFSRSGLTPDGAKQVPVRLLGNDAAWLEYETHGTAGDAAWLHRETIVNLGSSAQGQKLHVFLSAPSNSADVDSLTRIAEEGLKITRP